MMDELERVLRGAYHLGALGATDEGADFYASRGWRRWEGSTSALTLEGIVATEEEDGSIFVFPLRAGLDLSGELTCDRREGDVW